MPASYKIMSPVPQGHTLSGSAMTASNPCRRLCKSRSLRSLWGHHQCSVVSSEGVSRDLTLTSLSSLGFVLSVWFISRSQFLVSSFIFHLSLGLFPLVFLSPIYFPHAWSYNFPFLSRHLLLIVCLCICFLFFYVWSSSVQRRVWQLGARQTGARAEQSKTDRSMAGHL